MCVFGVKLVSFVCLSLRPPRPAYLSSCRSVHLSICPPVDLPLSHCLSRCLSTSVSLSTVCHQIEFLLYFSLSNFYHMWF